MKSFELNKNELFKDFKHVLERVNTEFMYEIKLIGEFSKINNSSTDFQKELFKLLPKDILTIGYKCSVCDYGTDDLKSICNTCLDNYKNDEECLKAEPNNIHLQRWVKYYEEINNKQLLLSFTTKSAIDFELIKSELQNEDFIFIEEASIRQVTPGLGDVECQCNAIIYDDMYILENN